MIKFVVTKQKIMKGIKFLLAAVVILFSSAFTVINAVSWQVKDDSYAVKFDTKGASGIIKGLTGTINFDETKLPQSGFDVTIDVNTLSTGNGMKNHHAKSESFFNAEKYPLIHFVSSKIEKTAAGYQVTGKLTIKATTKDVAIPFTFEGSGNEGTFKGNFEINRTDYDLVRNGVGEVVKIELVIPVKK
jgi:polyisoprenoid-binding protein YceI